MRKTSVYLSLDESSRVARLAARSGTTQAEVIRRAIRVYDPERHGDRNFALAASADGPGGSVADLTDVELLEDFGS